MAKAMVGSAPSFSTHVRLGERGAPVPLPLGSARLSALTSFVRRNHALALGIGQTGVRKFPGTFISGPAYLSLYLQVGRDNPMFVRIRSFRVLPVVALFAAILFCPSRALIGQDSDVNLALHAHSHASAAEAGLPAYPGATLYKDDHDTSADLGVTVGDFHMSLIAVKYVTSDSPERVLAFYRKPLSRYGEVLECDHGKPVGALTTTRSGLTCGQAQVGGNSSSSTDHEIRAGVPNQYRIVGIDESQPGSTRFDLVYLDLPKDNGNKTK
jgi:hypothetical protein